MKQLSLLLVILFPAILCSQEKGVQFEHTLNWTDIRKNAKAENKYIFMHCYTSYCGPSRYMSSVVYPTDEAGNYMNDKFISIKLQLDTTGQDNMQVKNWYNDAHEISETYNIHASPTYMIFDPDGNPVHRFTGQVQTTGEFIEKTKNAFDPGSQYFTLLKKYKEGKRDSAFLHKIATAVIAAYDTAWMNTVVNDYLNTQQDLYTSENLGLLDYVTHTSHDNGFRVMLNNPRKTDAILGQGFTDRRIHGIIISEEIVQKYSDKNPDWNVITAAITKKYPDQADQVIAKAKVGYYMNQKDWDHFQFAMVNYMKKYEARTSSNELNDYA